MTIHRFVAAIALFLFMGTSLAAHAGQVLLSYDVAARYDEDFNSLPFSWSPGEAIDNIDDGPGIYQVDMFLQTVNLQPGERGFAALAFDVDLGPGLSGLTIALEYQPDVITVDSNGAAPGGVVPKWSTNTDAGVPGDWKGILVSIPGGQLHPDDPRQTLGDPDPEFFGSLFVRWDGLSSPSMTFDNYQYSIANTSGVFTSPQDGPDVVLPFQYTFFDSAVLTVFGNNVPIVSGDGTPSLLDNTSFGDVQLGDPNVQREFSMEVTGVGPVLFGEPVLTGPYSIVGGFPDSIEGIANFTIALDPGLPRGDYPGSITIPNDSSNANSYSFNLFARVVPEPASFAHVACGFAVALAIQRLKRI